MAAYSAERKNGSFALTGSSVGTFSPASNCTAGNTLVLVVCNPGANACWATAVTDSEGNTWTTDAVMHPAGGGGVSIFSTKQNVGALTTSDVITVTNGGSVSVSCYIWLEEFTGQYDFDVAATNSGTSGTAINTGTTGTTASTDEFAVAGFAPKKSGGGVTWTWTKDAAYTNFTTPPPQPTGSQTLSTGAHYRLLSATGTQICSDTVSASTNLWSAAIATYKVAVTSTPKSDSDTGAGVDTATTLTAAISDSDVDGTPIEAIGSRVFSASDTGTGADFGSLPAPSYIPKRKPRIYADAVQRKSRW